MSQQPQQPTASDQTAASDVFVQLLVEHRHRLFAFIVKQVVNRADAEDIFQKTCIVLWKKMEQYDHRGSFFHWSCGIAFNEVRNFIKVQRRSRVHFDEELTSLLAEEAQQEEDQSTQRLASLRLCIQELPERQREIVRQCYFENASISEVAEKLGRERTALYKQLARLRDKLIVCIRRRIRAEGETV